MFDLCVLYIKDKRHRKDNQDKDVQIKYRQQQQQNPGGVKFSAPVQTGPGTHTVS
jgi:hypothetical protein